jgi:hypothetical protein
MLELPGWSRERLAASASDVVEAARWNLFVGAVWDNDAVAELFAPEPAKDPKVAETQRMTARSKGQRYYDELRKLIFPEDEVAGDG